MMFESEDDIDGCFSRERFEIVRNYLETSRKNFKRKDRRLHDFVLVFGNESTGKIYNILQRKLM